MKHNWQHWIGMFCKATMFNLCYSQAQNLNCHYWSSYISFQVSSKIFVVDKGNNLGVLRGQCQTTLSIKYIKHSPFFFSSGKRHGNYCLYLSKWSICDGSLGRSIQMSRQGMLMCVLLLKAERKFKISL